jgi:hypothetical protein
MTALLISYLLLTYVVVPGILYRRIFGWWVPLRRFQWSRTEEITSSVLTTLFPFLVALLIVRHTHWFGEYPLSFSDSVALKWTDYKDVFSASYSEKYFTENRQQLLLAVERVGRRQVHFVIWYYLAVFIEALIIGSFTCYYGNIRAWKPFGWNLKNAKRFYEKFFLPSISEWHAMFTPFTFATYPKRIVQVDVLTSDGMLYQGEVDDFHVNSEGRLMGILMKNARRYLRAEFLEDRKANKDRPRESYWRAIPGESFYLIADKISNLNLSYLPQEPLAELAQGSLKKLKITASVKIQPAEVISQNVDELKPADAALKGPGGAPSGHPQPIKLPRDLNRNFRICGHCVRNNQPSPMLRMGFSGPIISRTDGRTFHIYLQFGPNPQPSLEGGTAPGRFLVHFDTRWIQRKSGTNRSWFGLTRPIPLQNLSCWKLRM